MNIKFAGDGRFASVQEASGSALNKIKSLESYYFYYNEHSKCSKLNRTWGCS